MFVLITYLNRLKNTIMNVKCQLALLKIYFVIMAIIPPTWAFSFKDKDID